MSEGLPTFNYRDIASPDRSLLETLKATCHLTGFFYLHHPGLVSGPLNNMFRHAREFFALPETEKNAIHLHQSPHYRGYSFLGEEQTQGAPDHKETLDMGLEAPALSSGTDYHGLQGPNQWPADWPEFQQASETYLRELHTVGETLMRTLALSLNLEEDTFSRHFNPPYCMLRLIAYPPVTRESGSHQGIGEHTDFGCLTLLAQDGIGGLEVRRADGTWITASPKPGCLVVNLGDMLEVWTSHYFIATPHRVQSPLGASTRYSIPFFFEPSLDTIVEPLSTDRLPPFERETFHGLPSEPVLYGKHMLEAFRRSYPGIESES